MIFVFESPTGLLFLPYFPMSFPVSPFPPFCPRNERKTGQETQPNTRDSRDAHSGSARNARQSKMNAHGKWQLGSETADRPTDTKGRSGWSGPGGTGCINAANRIPNANECALRGSLLLVRLHVALLLNGELRSVVRNSHFDLVVDRHVLHLNRSSIR